MISGKALENHIQQLIDLGVKEKPPGFDDRRLSDGYHSFGELYDFRLQYNAALFNEWAAQGKYEVHKSARHSDGEPCFGGGWFIVVAVLPSGQISNHYKLEHWGRFDVPAHFKAQVEFDGHTSADVLKRLGDINWCRESEEYWCGLRFLEYETPAGRFEVHHSPPFGPVGPDVEFFVPSHGMVRGHWVRTENRYRKGDDVFVKTTTKSNVEHLHPDAEGAELFETNHFYKTEIGWIKTTDTADGGFEFELIKYNTNADIAKRLAKAESVDELRDVVKDMRDAHADIANKIANIGRKVGEKIGEGGLHDWLKGKWAAPAADPKEEPRYDFFQPALPNTFSVPKYDWPIHGEPHKRFYDNLYKTPFGVLRIVRVDNQKKEAEFEQVLHNRGERKIKWPNKTHEAHYRTPFGTLKFTSYGKPPNRILFSVIEPPYETGEAKHSEVVMNPKGDSGGDTSFVKDSQVGDSKRDPRHDILDPELPLTLTLPIPGYGDVLATWIQTIRTCLHRDVVGQESQIVYVSKPGILNKDVSKGRMIKIERQYNTDIGRLDIIDRPGKEQARMLRVELNEPLPNGQKFIQFRINPSRFQL